MDPVRAADDDYREVKNCLWSRLETKTRRWSHWATLTFWRVFAWWKANPRICISISSPRDAVFIRTVSIGFLPRLSILHKTPMFRRLELRLHHFVDPPPPSPVPGTHSHGPHQDATSLNFDMCSATSPGFTPLRAICLGDHRERFVEKERGWGCVRRLGRRETLGVGPRRTRPPSSNLM